MTRLSAAVYCFIAALALVGVYRVCDTIDTTMRAVHDGAIIGDGTPPKYLNDPERKPFSYRRTK